MKFNDRGTGVFIILVALIWICLIASVAFAFSPSSPIHPTHKHTPYTGARVVKALAPQGWEFFTKSRRTPYRLTFEKERGKWVSASKAPVARPSNIFGLDRAVRAQGVEYGLLTHALNDDAWVTCEKKDVLECLNQAPLIRTVENTSPNPTFCGTVGFIHQKPVPWAWRESRNEVAMPSEVVKVKINCEIAN